MFIKRGNIYLANLSPSVGSEIEKIRPVLVISNDVNNLYSNTITILPITSSTYKIYPFEVFVSKGIANLPKDSKIKSDQIRTIDKIRLVKEIGTIPAQIMIDVIKSVKIHLEF